MIQRKRPAKRKFIGMAGSPLSRVAPECPVGRPRKFRNTAEKQQDQRDKKVIIQIGLADPEKDRLKVTNRNGAIQSVTTGGYDSNKLVLIEANGWRNRNKVAYPKSWNLENAAQREIIRKIVVEQITPEPKGAEHFWTCNYCGRGLNFIEEAIRHLIDWKKDGGHQDKMRPLIRAAMPKKEKRKNDPVAPAKEMKAAIEMATDELKKDHELREFSNARFKKE